MPHLPRALLPSSRALIAAVLLALTATTLVTGPATAAPGADPAPQPQVAARATADGPVATTERNLDGPRTLRRGRAATPTVTGRAGIPANATGVWVRLTASPSAKAGTVTISAPGNPAAARLPLSTKRTTSTVTYLAPSAAGRIRLASTTTVRTRLTAVGYTSGDVAAGSLIPVDPHTRLNTATGLGGPALRRGRPTVVHLTGTRGVPPSGVAAVAVQVTSRTSSGSGTLTSGRTRLATATTAPATTFSVLPVDAAGTATLTSTAAGRTQARLDVLGWVPALDTSGNGPDGTTSRRALATTTGGYLAGRSGRAVTWTKGTRTLPVAGRGTLPAHGLHTAITHLTWTRATKNTTLRTTRAGKRLPATGLPITRGSGSGTLLLPVAGNGKTTVALGAGKARVRLTTLGYLADTDPSGDTTAPTLTVTSPADATTRDVTDGPLTIAGTVADTGSDVAAVDVRIDGRPAGTATLDRSTRPATYTLEQALPAGSYQVVVTATDTAGNTTTSTARTVTVTDTTTATQTITEDLAETPVLTDVEENLTRVTDDTVVVAGTVPGLAAGDVLVLGATTQAPSGLLRRVTSVQVAGSTTVLTTVPAALDEAFGTLHVEETIALTGPATTSRTAGRTAAARAASATWDVAAEMAVDLCRPTRGGALIPCSEDGADTSRKVGGKVGVGSKGTTSLHIDIDVDREHWYSTPKVHEFEIALEGTIDTSISAALTGSMTHEFLDEVLWEKNLATITIPTPIPVVIVPELEVSRVGEVSASGEVSATCTVVNQFAAGARWTRAGGWSDIDDVTPTDSAGCDRPEASVSLSASAGVKVELATKIYDVAGPTVSGSFQGKVELATTTTTYPEFSAGVEVGASIGVEVGLFEFTLLEKSLPDLINGYFELFHVGGDLIRNPLDGPAEDVTVRAAGDTAAVAFRVPDPAASHVTAHLAASTLPDGAVLTVVDADDDTVGTDTVSGGHAEVLLTDPESGRYTVKVTHDDHLGNAKLWLTTPRQTAPLTFNPGDHVRADIDVPGRRVHTPVDLAEGDRIGVLVQHPGVTGEDLTLSVRAPSGAMVEGALGHYGDADVYRFTAPETGRYRINYYAADAAATTADAVMTARPAATMRPPVDNHIGVTAYFPNGPVEALATIDHDVDTDLTIRLEDISGFDAAGGTLTVSDGDTVVASGEVVGKRAELTYFHAASTGRYVATFTPRDPRGGGSMKMTVWTSDPSQRSMLDDGPRVLNIQQPGQEPTMVLDIPERGATFGLGAFADANLAGSRATITLTDASGNLATSPLRLPWDYNELGSITLSGGRYTVTLSDPDGATGKVTLWATSQGYLGQFEVNGEQVGTEIDAPARVNQGTLWLSKGQRVNISARNQEYAFNPTTGYVDVTLDGTWHDLPHATTLTGNGWTAFTAPEPGYYQVRVGLFEGATNPLSINMVEAKTTTLAPDADTAAMATSRPGQELRVKVTVPAGQRTRITADQVAFPGGQHGGTWSLVPAGQDPTHSDTVPMIAAPTNWELDPGTWILTISRGSAHGDASFRVRTSAIP